MPRRADADDDDQTNGSHTPLSNTSMVSERWQKIERDALLVSEPELWRQALASGIHAVSGCDTLVFSCPAQGLGSSEWAASNADLWARGEAIVARYLTGLDDRAAWARQVGDRGTVFETSRQAPARHDWREHDALLFELTSHRDYQRCVVSHAFAKCGSPPVAIILLFSLAPHHLEAMHERLYILSELIGARVADARSFCSSFGLGEAVVDWKGLSDRERQIASLIAEGYTNLNIANRIGIAEATVAVHVKHIYRKMRVGSRTQLASYMRRS